MSWDQLVSMRLRGQLARFDQLSRDGRNWDPADSVEALFPRSGTPGAFVPPPDERKKSTGTGAGTGAATGSGRKKSAAPEEVGFLILDDEPSSSGRRPSAPAPAAPGRGPAAIPRPGPADDPQAWFYADAGMPQGPVPLSELKDLAGAGRIHPDSLYWRAGLEQWTAGTALPELAALWRPENDDSVGSGTSSAAGAVTLPPRSRTDAPGPDGPIPSLDPLATASLPLNLLCGLGNLAAVVAAAIALRRIGRSSGSLRGRGFALVGLAIGLIGTLASAFVLFRLFSGSSTDG